MGNLISLCYCTVVINRYFVKPIYVQDELNLHLLKADKKEALNEIRASFLI